MPPPATMSPAASVRHSTAYRSALTISVHIAASVIIASKKIDIWPSIIVTVVTSVIAIASSITCANITGTTR